MSNESVIKVENVVFDTAEREVVITLLDGRVFRWAEEELGCLDTYYQDELLSYSEFDDEDEDDDEENDLDNAEDDEEEYDDDEYEDEDEYEDADEDEEEYEDDNEDSNENEDEDEESEQSEPNPSPEAVKEILDQLDKLV